MIRSPTLIYHTNQPFMLGKYTIVSSDEPIKVEVLVSLIGVSAAIMICIPFWKSKEDTYVPWSRVAFCWGMVGPHLPLGILALGWWVYPLIIGKQWEFRTRSHIWNWALCSKSLGMTKFASCGHGLFGGKFETRWAPSSYTWSYNH